MDKSRLNELVAKGDKMTEEEQKELQAHVDAYRAKTNETDREYGLTHAAIIRVTENGIVPAFKVVALMDDAPEAKAEGSA